MTTTTGVSERASEHADGRSSLARIGRNYNVQSLKDGPLEIAVERGGV